MPDEPTTLSMLAGLEADATGTLLSAKERQEAMGGIAEAVTAAQGAGSWTGAAAAVLDRIATDLQTPLANLLREGWRQDGELRKSVTGTGSKAAPYGEVSLHDHKVTALIRPSAQLVVNGIEGPKIEFVVRTTLTFSALILVVRKAVITGFKAGKIVAALEVNYVSNRGDKKEYPVIRPRKREFQADREFVLPGGGIAIV